MAKKSALGRGIDSIFLDNSTGSDDIYGSGDGNGRILQLDIMSVEPRPDQPRKYFDEEMLANLAESISVHGVLQPIIVREVAPDRYRIVAGERRWRASKLAGLKQIPAIVLDADELTASEISIIENIQRENLNPYEEAEAYRTLLTQYDLTQEQLSARIGKSRSAIANSLRLLELPDSIIQYLRTGEITAGHARALLSLENRSDIPVLADKIISEGLSVRAAEALAKKMNKKEKSQGKSVDEEGKEHNDDNKDNVNYVGILENLAMESLGRPVKIKNSGRRKYITIEYETNQDLEELLTALCGNIFDKI